MHRSVPPAPMSPALLALLAAAFATGAVNAQDVLPARALASDRDNLWTTWSAMPAQAVAPETRAFIRPDKAQAVALNIQAMRDALALAPLEFTDGARNRPLFIDLPTPAGGFQRFEVVQTQILAPELAAKFPHIKTYAGVAVDDPFARVRLDLTDMGFRAQVRTATGAWYIDPVSFDDVTHYAVYDRADYRRPITKQFRCGVADAAGGVRLAPPAAPAAASPDAEPDNFGTQIRTYRAAVGVTGEYTAFYGGTVSGGLSGVTTTINRVSGVYEDDLAVRFQLIANNNLVIYTNGATDPYSNGNTTAMLAENANTLATIIGNVNFDIGHVFGTGPGGVAALGSVCTANKARGVSTLTPPQGDPFDIDYVAHEMGHQFAGNHTFASCGGAGPQPVEPGSGVTIMGYAGICGGTNIASNSIATFHIRNVLNEMRPFITGTGATCGTLTNTGNNIPTVNGGPDFTIPARTPVILTMTGSDPDGDPVLYQWEQNDSQGANLGTDTGFNAIWRSDLPTASPVKIIPLSQQNGAFRSGEILPTTNRTINLRAIVRDSRGGLNSDPVALTVVATNTGGAAVGPFVVTAPNTNVSWAGNSNQNVTWNVANTNTAPLNAASVEIELSVNGGASYTSLGTFPNTGSASVLVPNTPTTQARIRVRGAGSIWFDRSDANFTITAPACYPNCDGSSDLPILNALDFSCFLQRYQVGAQLPQAQQVTDYANCDGSTSAPALNALDFGCFLTRYRNGCN